MSKLVLPLMGIGGVGVVSVGSYMVFGRDNKSAVSQTKETFKSKYSYAVLEEKDGLWEAKFAIFTGSEKPVHKKLIEAQNKKTSNPTEAKDLHKKACIEIYDSELGNSPYLKDFQTYCAKTMKDGIANPSTWNEQVHTDGTKWNQKLTNLSGHDESQLGVLDEELKKVKIKLASSDEASPNWNNDKRKALKDWCDAVKEEIFMGELDTKFKHAKLYCVGN